MKKFIALGIVLILALTLAACGAKDKKQESVVGTWVLDTDWIIATSAKYAAREYGLSEEECKEKVVQKSQSGSFDKYTLIFHADGTGITGGNKVFTYSVKNSKLTISVGDGDEKDILKCSLKDGKLILNSGRDALQYKRA